MPGAGKLQQGFVAAACPVGCLGHLRGHKVILQAVEREGSLRKAAKALGVDHSTLVKKYRHFQQDNSGPDGR